MRMVQGNTSQGGTEMKAPAKQLCLHIALYVLGFVFETLVGCKVLHLRNETTEVSFFVPLGGSRGEEETHTRGG